MSDKVRDFHRYAIQRIVDKARGPGIDIPKPITEYLCTDIGPLGAILWAQTHPDDDTIHGCCDGEVTYGADRCTCWEPVFDTDQREHRPPASAADIHVQHTKCGDCAFRPDSPERADDHTAEALYTAAGRGIPFWCHQGMRRPTLWRHPDGRTVPGDPANWQPPMINGVPYQTDGTPALLCAGWVAIAAANGWHDEHGPLALDDALGNVARRDDQDPVRWPSAPAER